MEWKNFEKILGTDKISPTHGEYRFARIQGKRILIFIRQTLMNDYQRYREVLKAQASNMKRDEMLAAAKEKLFLPKNVDFETLHFIEEIKTTKPIPWIREFHNVTEVKREVHRQLLNELARWFIDRECQLQDLIGRFSIALEKSTPEQRQDILSQIGYTKELIDEIELKNTTIAESRTQIAEKDKEIENLAKEKEKNRQQIDDLENKKDELVRRVGELQQQKTGLLIGGSGSTPTDILAALSGVSNPSLSTSLGQEYCEKCGTNLSAGRFFSFSTPRKCPKCLRTLCNSCYTGGLSGFMGMSSFSPEAECADCKSGGGGGLIVNWTEPKAE